MLGQNFGLSAQATATGVPAIEFRVWAIGGGHGGLSVDLGPPKQRAVLASLLLAEGRVVSTDRLIQAVWGDDLPPRAQSGMQGSRTGRVRVINRCRRSQSSS